MNPQIQTKLKTLFFTLSAMSIGVFSFIFIHSILLDKNLNLPLINNYGIEVNPSGTDLDYLNVAEVATGVDSSKPKYFYFNRASQESMKKLKISAESYIVGDLNTGEIILAKNAEKKLPIASVSKLMTALVTSEIKEDTDIAKVSKTALATYGENGNFKLGEKIKTGDLLYPLLLESSNDAAEILAEHYGRTDFLNKMNLQAKKIKMNSTSFDDPSGLSFKNQSTVSDLFKLTGYIKQKQPSLFDITTKRSYSNTKHSWFSTNQFLNESGYTGGKSGYTNPARQTVVSTFSLPMGQSGSRPIAITLLQSTDRKKDIDTIIKYLRKNIYYGGPADAASDWIKERLDLPDIDEPDYVTLAFGGDIMLDRGVRSSVNKNFQGDYSALFEKLGILKKADIAFANLEGPASDKGVDMRNLYSFRMDPSVIPALKGAGISIVSVANNHVGDWGRLAYIDTLERLKENEILYTGGGTLAEAESPTIIEKYGMKIGFLGFSDVGPNWMGVTKDNNGLLLANNPRFAEIINNASKQVDYLIVSFHFGDEYKLKHNARQEFLAHGAIDAGAKIVIGHHPHVVQDTEIYSPKSCTQSSCMGFIAYSLGNFIFDQGFSVNTMQGMLLEMKLYRSGEISINKDTVKLNKVFQPYTVIKGIEQKLKFTIPKTQ
jgi:D-alanyl-D-alanine carboxypeptidase/poly-gamma-glutamate capsule biosynthesis protein CapA/YwtB (metallophosphatase superfamily)